MADNSWEQLGKNDPYFGVLTNPRFATANLNADTLDEFFKTGEEYVEEMLSTLQSSFPDADLSRIKTALDFGCGTGRILIPFATRFQKVTGIDISDSMIKESKKNLQERGLHNTELFQSSDFAGMLFSTSFDLIHTYIVLQHVPTVQGYAIIKKLISLVSVGGFGMIHFTFDNSRSAIQKVIHGFKGKSALGRKLLNVINGRAANAPFMQMNSYDFKKVFSIFREQKIEKIAITFTDHDGEFGASVYFRK